MCSLALINFRRQKRSPQTKSCGYLFLFRFYRLLLLLSGNGILAQPKYDLDSSAYEYIGGDEFHCNPAGGSGNPNAQPTMTSSVLAVAVRHWAHCE